MCFLLLKSSAQNFGLKSAPKLQDCVLTISLLLFPKPNFKRKDLRTISLRLIFGEKQPVFPDSALEGQKGRRDKLFRRAMKTSWYLFTVISSSFTYFIAFLPTFFLIGTGSYYTRSSFILSSILQHQKIWWFEDYYKNLPKPIILETDRSHHSRDLDPSFQFIYRFWELITCKAFCLQVFCFFYSPYWTHDFHSWLKEIVRFVMSQDTHKDLLQTELQGQNYIYMNLKESHFFR